MIQIIHAKMRELNISQAGLASKTGIEKGYISRFMRGKVENPTLNTLVKISDTLGLTMRDLFPADHPDITGFIEINGEVRKVCSYEDLETILREKK